MYKNGENVMEKRYKSNESISYEQILDDTNQLIQISDLNFNMQYANRPARMFTSHEVLHFSQKHFL